MDLKKEKLKMKIYLILYIIFLVLTFVSAGYVIYNKDYLIRKVLNVVFVQCIKGIIK